MGKVRFFSLIGATAAIMGCVGYGYPGSGGGYPSSIGSYPTSNGGYPAAGYGNTVRCESIDNRTHYCTADTRGGVRLSRRLSDAQCIQGRSWGYDNGRIWVSRGCRADFVTSSGGGYGSGYGNAGNGNPGYGNPGYGNGQSVRCESEDNRYKHCTVDTRGGVRLSRRLSNSQCIQGSSWGSDGRGVWVSQGCRAEFVSGLGGGYGTPDAGNGRTMRCESEDGGLRRCDGRIQSGVQLIRQISHTRCVERRNWGWDRNGIWVNNGCRAEFRVY